MNDQTFKQIKTNNYNAHLNAAHSTINTPGFETYFSDLKIYNANHSLYPLFYTNLKSGHREHPTALRTSVRQDEMWREAR